LIAQHPVQPRDASRLLVLERASGRIEHRAFPDIREYLEPGDCLVLNDTRVIPARFFCRRVTGGKVEALFLHQQGQEWLVMLKRARRLKIGEHLACVGSDTTLVITERRDRGEWLVRPEPAVLPLELLVRIGWTPLPPYIRRGAGARGQPEPADADRYQTVYARQAGAVAAPTAGLHFTPELLDRLAACGVERADVTLHVGAGTFVPIQTDDLAQHHMHAEWFEATPAAVAALWRARAAGGRIVAVGTTSVRVLESLPGLEPTVASAPCGRRRIRARPVMAGSDRPITGAPPPGPQGGDATGPPILSRTQPQAGPPAQTGWTDLFIYPPYQFRHVDRLVTNFHLPGSTLLALVMAFASPELIRAAYLEAIEQRYRFYSFGDAMLIL
jgi:S-adenosylmethionine:tRNA ribosyltransferase-isomerase